MQLGRDVVTDRAMRSNLVVVSAPMLQLFADVGKTHERMCVQEFCPKLAVESLDEAVVSRLSRPGEVERDVLEPHEFLFNHGIPLLPRCFGKTRNAPQVRLGRTQVRERSRSPHRAGPVCR